MDPNGRPAIVRASRLSARFPIATSRRRAYVGPRLLMAGASPLGAPNRPALGALAGDASRASGGLPRSQLPPNGSGGSMPGRNLARSGRTLSLPRPVPIGVSAFPGTHFCHVVQHLGRGTRHATTSGRWPTGRVPESRAGPNSRPFRLAAPGGWIPGPFVRKPATRAQIGSTASHLSYAGGPARRTR